MTREAVLHADVDDLRDIQAEDKPPFDRTRIDDSRSS
jgi:hypothetical protein